MSNLSEVMNAKVCLPKAIPNDWSWESLDKICKPKQWKTISSSDMTDSGYPVFGANGFIGYYSEYNHAIETIAITCRGNTCGTINRIPAMTYITGNSMALEGIDEKNVLRGYLYYALKYRTVTDAISGSAQPQITAANLKHVKFPVAPLPEQKKIAAILTSVDDVIEKTQAQIDKLKDLKTGMMQELLTRGVGVDGKPHTEFKDSPVGRIPKGWGVVSADSVTDAVMVGVVVKPTQYYVESGVPALRSANVRELGLTLANLKYFSPESNELLSKSKLQLGDLLTVRTGYPGTTAVVTDKFVGTNCIDVVITRPSKLIDSNYFAMWVNSDSGKGQVLKAQGGLAQQHFNVGDMRSLLIALPSIQEQVQIFRSIHSITQKIEVMQSKYSKLCDTKKALMQDLLTGKVRVKVDS
ncbi:restriction endonuclease subunit S [Vibrio splendidus]|uniref:restriction endonuclease subunit S n=1 Tax=Vibrio splendidus TaxID=29497 RepID=UPI002469315E|nr:restriction endonuclease subunit S [Vibrio splendidus]MDH5917764.1 restriction endonuclease subunit S [Vibrio splendidus]